MKVTGRWPLDVNPVSQAWKADIPTRNRKQIEALTIVSALLFDNHALLVVTHATDRSGGPRGHPCAGPFDTRFC